MFSLSVRCFLGIAFFLAAGGGYAQTGSVGVSFVTDFNEASGRQLALTLWYPSDEKGAVESVGGNAVFLGAEGIADAQVRLGTLPLVLISHGGLRSANNSGAWFAQRMAQAGLLAVEVNAARVKSPVESVNELWLRPADMTQALNALLHHPDWSSRIDHTRISSVGFYLGGTASLLLSGVPVDEEALRSSCEQEFLSPDCDWFAANHISLSADHLRPMPLDLGDARLSSVVAIAPEYLHAFPQLSLVAEQTKVGVVVLGGQSKSSNVSREVSRIEQANPFDGFGHCTPRGAFIIEEDGGSAQLCGDASGRRQRVHDQIVGRVLTGIAKVIFP